MCKNNPTCPVCETKEIMFRWTDTHGVAQCDTCGAPFRLYFYDEQDKPIEGRSPECIVTPLWVPLLKRYRAETGCIIPGGHSFPGGQEMARDTDFRAFEKWCDANRAEIDAAKAAA